MQFNLIAGDWKVDSAEELLGRLESGIAALRRRGRGVNVALHDGGQGGLNQPRLKTVAAVDALLTRLAAAGDTTFVRPTAAGALDLAPKSPEPRSTGPYREALRPAAPQLRTAASAQAESAGEVAAAVITPAVGPSTAAVVWLAAVPCVGPAV